MSDMEILDQVINTLDNIEIPTKYVEKIGIPISNSSNLLKALSRAVKEMIRKEKEKEQVPATIEPVPEEPVEEAPAEETPEVESEEN